MKQNERYLSSCQNTSARSCKKGRNGARNSFLSHHCVECVFSVIKSEVATWTIMDGSGSPSIACSSLLIQGSILCNIFSLVLLLSMCYKLKHSNIISKFSHLKQNQLRQATSNHLVLIIKIVDTTIAIFSEMHISIGLSITCIRQFLDEKGTACNLSS